MHKLIIFGLFFIETQSYVLLQVRKQNNNYSNLDALIHKVIPSEKVHEIANKLGAKQLTELKHDTKQDTEEDREIDNMKRDADNKKRNASIMQRDAGIRQRDADIKKRDADIMKRDGDIKKKGGDMKKRGANNKKRDATNTKRDDETKQENDFVANIEKTILNFVKKDKPMFRSQDKYVKSKVINFRNSKPSVVFEIDSKAIVRTFKDLLSSKTFQGYMEKFVRKAGVVYRAIIQEIDKDY